jgi:hypothetical protein
MIARNWTWGSLLICVGFLALTQSAVAQSDGDRALMERERQVRERLRAEEEKRRQDEFYEQLRKQNEKGQKDQEKRNAEMWGPKPSDGGSYPSGGNSAAPAVDKARKEIQKLPPLAADRNPLLGKWKLDKTKQRQTNALAEFNAMFGGGVCEMFFGDGIWEFRAKTIVGIDQGIGEMVLSETEYRGGKDLVAVLPKKGLSLLMFKFVGPDRIEETLVSAGAGAPCTMVRVGSTAAAMPGKAAANAPSGAAARAPSAQQPVQIANVSPTPPASSRPPTEICRQMMMDKLGVARVDEVRQMIGVRFRETLTGTVPNTQNLRLDARGSACDDSRINATLYDFDAAGVLQSITLVWQRPAGPAPAPIFSERAVTLARIFNAPAPQSPSRLQADTSMGRLILEDLPERNLLLEAYKTPK